MQIGDRGKALFREWEGVVPHVYLDSGGAPTIGIGRLLTPSERSSGTLWLRGQASPSRMARRRATAKRCWSRTWSRCGAAPTAP